MSDSSEAETDVVCDIDGCQKQARLVENDVARCSDHATTGPHEVVPEVLPEKQNGAPKNGALHLLGTRGSKDVRLRKCFFCKVIVRDDQFPMMLKNKPTDDAPIIGWGHRMCYLENELKTLQGHVRQLQTQLLGSSNLNAALTHAAGGSVRVTKDDVAFAEKNGNSIRMEQQPDGSFVIQDPGLISRPPAKKLILTP